MRAAGEAFADLPVDVAPAAESAGGSDDEYSVGESPCMPVGPCMFQHREKFPDCAYPFVAAVARPVNKTEARSNPAAQAALLKEWDRLRAVG